MPVRVVMHDPDGAAAGPGLSIRRQFVLTKSYRPKTDGIVAHPTFDPSKDEKLDPSRVYLVTGFDFKGNIVLQDTMIGIDYLIPQDAHVHFIEVGDEPKAQREDERAAPTWVGYPASAAGPWERQVHSKGCWLAVMAVLTSRKQKEIQESLEWPDTAMYGIQSHELVEFSQMIKWPVERIANSDAARVLSSLRAGHLVIVAVPEHVMVAFAITADGSRLRVWDPADGSIQEASIVAVAKQAECYFVRKN